jgi:hypothetical protein
MHDVTARMAEFREAARHLWNTHLRHLAEPEQDWDVRDAFNSVAVTLFRLLVLRPLGREDWEYLPDQFADRKPLPFLRVVAKSATDLHINRETTSGYWDFPVVDAGDLELHFLQFFDWSELGHRDFAYYRVRIGGSKRYPALVGKDALVRIGEGVQVLAEAAEQRDAPDDRVPNDRPPGRR